MTALTKEMKEAMYDPKLEKSKVITSELFDYFAKKNKDGSITFKVIRAGKRIGDLRRGGTWYEQQIYEGQKSRYSPLESLRSTPVGVGAKEVIRSEITLKKPYIWNWTGKGNEAQAVVNLAKEVIPKAEFTKLSKGIRGHNAEKAFAAIEHRLSEIISQDGYDGIVFGDEHPDGAILPKQIFKFSKLFDPKHEIKSMTPQKKFEKEQKAKAQKGTRSLDPQSVKLVSGIPAKWYQAMVAGIKRSSDVRNPYQIVTNIWKRLPVHTQVDIRRRAAKGEAFRYDLPLPTDLATRGTGTLRIVKPFKLAEAQVNLTAKDMAAVKKSGIFRSMKRADGSICQVARCKGTHPVNIFVDQV